MCTERSLGFQHVNAPAAGVSVVIPDALGLGSIWKTITTVNDTDQDILVGYSNTKGTAGTFIVPKSIKGFTKGLKTPIDNATLTVKSLGANAVGNITFNLGT